MRCLIGRLIHRMVHIRRGGWIDRRRRRLRHYVSDIHILISLKRVLLICRSPVRIEGAVIQVSAEMMVVMN